MGKKDKGERGKSVSCKLFLVILLLADESWSPFVLFRYVPINRSLDASFRYVDLLQNNLLLVDFLQICLRQLLPMCRGFLEELDLSVIIVVVKCSHYF